MAGPAFAQDAIVRLDPAFPNLQLEHPVGFRHANDASNRVYVVEHGGRILVFENDPNVQEPGVFLDISERLSTPSPGELFTIEFHPEYAENGHFFVRYKLRRPHRTVLSRFTRLVTDSLRGDPDSEVVLLEIETPDNDLNHHGGDLAFGPDGYLYVALGDGGTHLDWAGNAQNRSRLLGKILRLDVDNPAEGMNYGIPPDNPFAGNDKGWREEIFAYGFRNPWRMNVDRETGQVWVADVGELTWEEVNLVHAGKNYGWPLMEGPECLGGGQDCDISDLVAPLAAYGREDGVCVAGGFVYRGQNIPELHGRYVFADYGTGNFWSIDASDPHGLAVPLMHAWVNASSFGVDASGEFYVTHYFGGVMKLVRNSTTTVDEPRYLAPAARLEPPYPNPAHGEVRIGFSTDRPAHVRLAVYDLLGREVVTLVDDHLAGGTNREVEFDASDLPTGVYFCRLVIGNEVQVRKVIVAR